MKTHARTHGILFSLILATVTVCGLPACQAAENPAATKTTASSKAPIKIGFIAPLGGASAMQGHGLLNGINMFLDQCDHKIAGRKVELIVVNDGSSVASGVQLTRQLCEKEHVNLITGLLLTNIGDAVAPLADEYQTPIITCIAGSDDTTQRRNLKWHLRVAPTTSQCGLPFGRYVYEKLGYRRVITFGMDYLYGWGMVGSFQKSFEDAGGKVVQKLWAPMGLFDFSEYMKQMRHDADAVFLLTVGGAVHIVPRQYQELGPKLPLVGGGTSTDEVLLDKIGPDVEGAYTVLNYSPEINTPENKRFVKAYQERFGAKPSFYSNGSYSAGMLMKKAIESIGGDVENKTKLIAALRSTKLTDAPGGTISIDSRGQAVENIYVRQVQKVNGKYQNSVVATFPQINQFWTYNPAEYLKQPSYSRDFPPCKYCSK